MENKIYLIYKDFDDCSKYFIGYIFGTEEDVRAYVHEHNKDIGSGWGDKYTWNEDWYTWDELDCLNPEKLAAFLNQGQFQV